MPILYMPVVEPHTVVKLAAEPHIHHAYIYNHAQSVCNYV